MFARGLELAGGVEPKDLTSLVTALADLAVGVCPALMEALEGRALETMTRFNAADVPELLISFSRIPFDFSPELGEALQRQAKSQTPNPKPQTPNPKPQIPNLQPTPHIPNLKPQAPPAESQARSRRWCPSTCSSRRRSPE